MSNITGPRYKNVVSESERCPGRSGEPETRPIPGIGWSTGVAKVLDRRCIDMADYEWPLDRLLSEVIGSGPKSAADMDSQQAREAACQVLSETPDPTTLGAFLLANRWKGNTPEELACFVDVMRAESVRTAEPSIDPVDCGANYDGKQRTALLGVAAGLVAATADTPVVVHSGDRVPTKEGTTYKHVLDALGVRTDRSPDESAAMVDEIGFGFYYQPRFNPLIDAVLDRRRSMGVRTFINTIETLANPANATVHLGSFYHLPFARKLVDTVELAESLPFERVLLFQGLEGYDDVRPEHTTVAEWTDGTFSDGTVESAEYGLSVVEEDLRMDDVAADSARITREVLAGDRTGPFAEAVYLNAAMRLRAGGTVDTIGEGVERAQHVIDAGEAAETLAVLSDHG